MDPCLGYVVRLSEGADCAESVIGGKAAKLAALAAARFIVPKGFCVTARAYERFVDRADLIRRIRMELGRKHLDTMRWEELWDAALRIRSFFASAPIPDDVVSAIADGLAYLGPPQRLAVRSSAPGEDDASRSFAGIHESVIGVVGQAAVLNAVRTVWASLFSDAAMLYRKELGLDPLSSRMAVVVQPVVDTTPSGVAFARDPIEPGLDHAVVEAVPGPCGDLVDGLVDPDRWSLNRLTGAVIGWRPGDRGEAGAPVPILAPAELRQLAGELRRVEEVLGWPPDMEWTGRGKALTLLQARPITTVDAPDSDQRRWYLTLRPSSRRLRAMAQRVAGELLPELSDLGERLAGEPLEKYNDLQLANALDSRREALDHWRQVYHDEFIPFAHGVRQLGVYYNDAMHPDDPFEFVQLLKGQEMAASRRNAAMLDLARAVREHADLARALGSLASQDADDWWSDAMAVGTLPGGPGFLSGFRRLLAEHMDIAHEDTRLADRPDLLLGAIIKLASGADSRVSTGSEEPGARPADLERRLLEAVGPQGQHEAEEIVAIGRVSWRLRDDDNLLLGRLESQVLRAVTVAQDRLVTAGRLSPGWVPRLDLATLLGRALREPAYELVAPAETDRTPDSPAKPDEGTPRQLVGQPAARGLVTGRVRKVAGLSGMAEFVPGDVLVCDSIQPTMTHLVPLAGAIIERRGGMLIHGAIIARELGIPCVNGVVDAMNVLRDGEIVTVDGYLGIVTVGTPEFGLEGVDLAV